MAICRATVRNGAVMLFCGTGLAVAFPRKTQVMEAFKIFRTAEMRSISPFLAGAAKEKES